MNIFDRLFKAKYAIGRVSLVVSLWAISACSSSAHAPAKKPLESASQPSTIQRQSIVERQSTSDKTTNTSASPDQPIELRISQLKIDPAKTVRIQGYITAIKAIRLVPPNVVFAISDSKETITALIKEQIILKEGTKVELIGKYKEIPSPVEGNAEAPREAVFVVERYTDLP
jgi:hypothetical protein